MSDDRDTTVHGEDENVAPTSVDKGKGKAIEPVQDVSMDEDEESSSEEEDQGPEEEEVEAEDEDNMEEIDMDNIIPDGRRTRGKNIDFAKAVQEDGDTAEEDEEDDEDFEDPDDEMME